MDDIEQRIEQALERRLGQLASGWTAVAAPAVLGSHILSTVRADFSPARSRARSFLEQLASNRDLLADILAKPAELLPACLKRLNISVDEFVAELERMKAAGAAAANRELTDEEAAGVVAAGSASLPFDAIDCLIRFCQFR